jgi:RNA polymerase sigma-70 factor, ECF subfamily
MSDLALARRLLAGDDAGFETFFGEYFPKLYRFALARLDDEDAAEEVAQAALVAAIRKLHTYRGEAAMFTWLCAICRREILARLERTGHDRAAIVPLIEERPDVRAALDALASSSSEDPEHAARRRELSRLVHVTLDHLPGRYGDALEWRYIEELPVDEVARRLGLGYKATESLLSRARQAFRDGFALVGGAS